jgi:PAS domain S-box-containing protein
MDGYDSRSLREKAEQALTSDRTADLPKDIDSVIHDLRVHQIELEMQNEELRSARDSLENARDEYAALYNQSPVAYVSLDANGLIIRSNHTFLQMLGRENELPRAAVLADLLDDESRAVFLGRFGAMYRHPEGKTIDLEFIVGENRISGRLSARRDLAGTILLAAIVNITEQKKAEGRIVALLDEKKLLLKEVHHRIRNNMNVAAAILSVQAARLSDSMAAQALEDARNRILSMMLVYDRLYHSEDFRSTPANTYLSQLLEEIAVQFEMASYVTIQRQIDDIWMDYSVLVPLGIIINELISNAFKHAFGSGVSGHIMVRMDRTGDGRAVLEVADDGPGLTEGFDINTATGFGFFLVRSFASQIAGQLEYRYDRGAVFRLTFDPATH